MRKEEIRGAIFDKVVLVPETEEDLKSIIDDIAALEDQSSNISYESILLDLLNRISSDCEDALRAHGLSPSEEPIKSMTAGKPLSFLKVDRQISAIGIMLRYAENARKHIEREGMSRDQTLELALTTYAIGTLQGHVNMDAVQKPLLAGRKSSDGGVKGRISPSRRENLARRNRKIGKDRQVLLDLGRKRHSIAGILAKRYFQMPDYPKSERQIRDILKMLDK